MPDKPGPSQRLNDDWTRREALRAGGLGVLGLSLVDPFRSDEAAAAPHCVGTLHEKTHAEIAKAGATIILAGVKGPGAYLERVEHDRIFAKELTIKGVKNADYRSFEIAINLIESSKYPLEKMHTHSFGLASLERALLTLAGRVPGENAVSVSINPALQT